MWADAPCHARIYHPRRPQTVIITAERKRVVKGHEAFLVFPNPSFLVFLLPLFSGFTSRSDSILPLSLTDRAKHFGMKFLLPADSYLRYYTLSWYYNFPKYCTDIRAVCCVGLYNANIKADKSRNNLMDYDYGLIQ